MRESIEDIRKRIEKIDHEILRLMANRTAAAVEMGQKKAGDSLPLRAPSVEEKVKDRYSDRAKEFGMSADSARQIASLLIRESIEAQGRIPRPSFSKRILVIGGNGKMGQWFCRFFALRGHKIRIYDFEENLQFPVEKDFDKGVADAEIIVIATPISVTKDILVQLLEKNPKGLIFDISSIKTPIIPILEEAALNGISICSVHPMFGPDAGSIIDRNVVVCNCGNQEAVELAKRLVDGANIIEMGVEEHDHIMAYVLGLSHAVNMAFFDALNRSGKDFDALNNAASTTFKRQVETSRSVASENPRLYYEIQHMNPYNGEALEYLLQAADSVKKAAENDGMDDFAAIMKKGKEYFGGK